MGGRAVPGTHPPEDSSDAPHFKGLVGTVSLRASTGRPPNSAFIGYGVLSCVYDDLIVKGVAPDDLLRQSERSGVVFSCFSCCKTPHPITIRVESGFL